MYLLFFQVLVVEGLSAIEVSNHDLFSSVNLLMEKSPLKKLKVAQSIGLT